MTEADKHWLSVYNLLVASGCIEDVGRSSVWYSPDYAYSEEYNRYRSSDLTAYLYYELRCVWLARTYCNDKS